MLYIATAESSAPRRDRQGDASRQIVESLSRAIQQQTTPASRASTGAGKVFAALALVLTTSLLSAPSAFASPSTLDPHSGLVSSCAACHGAAGEGASSGAIPRLAGQNADYLAHALSMFKDGTRASPVMQSVAHNLSDSDMREIAEYFAAQHPPLAQAAQAPQAGEIEAGRKLAELGDGSNLAACFGCHAAGGKGNGARFPSIAGQPASFTVERLHEFQARAKNGAAKPGSMTAIAAQMTDAQIEGAAAYLSTLPR
ncbi:c-type cytochrome [Pararobbsia alpina]|uniref:Cytochrome c-552 n=1 Tax=Pararobbsia alpina TaxID=621374 RepID=A0A6S7B5I4_9BURK|nr:c-type cytochrome [Pararobbsia alpina]CAB3778671.1 Cytochrome c-552 [Pararobbsia alpina]